MIVEIRLSNFFSIKDEIVLDLRARKINTEKARALPQNVIKTKNGMELLKSIAIFGANGSGKSNIIKAIEFCKAFIVSSNNYQPGFGIPISPFKFQNFFNQPSIFGITFFKDEILYEYSFEINIKQVLKETLYHYPNSRKALLFERDETKGSTVAEKYKFGPSFKKGKEIAELTIQESLYLSRSAALNNTYAQTIVEYFQNQLPIRTPLLDYESIEKITRLHKEKVLEFINAADLDIVDYEIIKKKQAVVNINFDASTQKTDISNKEVDAYSIVTTHTQDRSVKFDFQSEESRGTIIMFYTALALFSSEVSKSYIYDELDNSLHSEILNFYLTTIHSSKETQVIFTAHDTSILNFELMRKDQFYFTEKREDGSTELFNLFEFKDFRENMNLEKAYKLGIFGGVPRTVSYSGQFTL